MKGSPLIRTFLIVVVLCAAGYGFVEISKPRREALIDAVAQVVERDSAEPGMKIMYYLTFSAAYREAMIQVGREEISTQQIFSESSGEARHYSGMLEVHEKKAPIFLKVDWLADDEFPRFVKLVVEAAGEKTFTHIFDGLGEIDDFVELPF